MINDIFESLPAEFKISNRKLNIKTYRIILKIK